MFKQSAHPRNALLAVGATAVVLASTLVAGPASASQQPPTSSRSSTDRLLPGTYVDPSFDPSRPSLVLGDGAISTRSNPCPDKAFTAIAGIWGTSVPGCNVIGTTANTNVYYKWYRHQGSPGSKACVQALGYDSRQRAVWTAAGCDTGQTKTIPWGKVAATKKIKGIGIGGWAGLQWS